MKKRSVLIAALALCLVLPVMAEAKDKGGGGGGGGRAVNVHAAPRAAVHVRSRGSVERRAVRAENRSAARSRAVERRANRGNIAEQRRANRANIVEQRERRANRAADTRREGRAERGARTADVRANREDFRRARFAARYNADRPRFWNGPARGAWRNNRYAGFVGWYGPLFWPYAYSDVFYWTFWPGGYAPGYWYYAYDDFFDGVFYGGTVYADRGASAPVRTVRRGTQPEQSQIASQTGGLSSAQVHELCKQPGGGVTAWPIADIDRVVQPNDEQRRLLNDLQAASQRAAETFAVACPAENDLAETAPGRIATIIGRLKATDEVIMAVRPALEAFYASLSDEQKQRFDTLGPKEPRTASRGGRNTVGSATPQGNGCGEASAGLTDLPMQQIETSVRPNDEQVEAFRRFKDATAKAVQHLQSHCPQDVAGTPASRLDAMHANIQAMIEAAEIIKPALEEFYVALSDEQKTRFNRLDKKMARLE